MELRGCGYLHFILAIKGGLVSKVPNVARGQPKLKFKNITDIYDDGLLSNNDDGMAERSCYVEIEETNVKTNPDASECNVNDDDGQRICNLDDNDFDDITLSQIKESCEARKRKRSQVLESSRRMIKIEDSFLDDYGEEQTEGDEDSDFMETLSSWKSKLSNNMKAKKKRCLKKTISTYTQEVMPVVKSEEIVDSQDFTPTSEEIQHGQDFPPSSEEILDCQEFSTSMEEIQVCQDFSPSCEEIQDGQEFTPSSEEIDNNKEILPFNGDSVALVEVKSEVPETDYFGGPDDYSIVEVQEAETIYEWNLESELKNERQRCVDFLPSRMVGPFNMDVVIRNYQLSNGQFPHMAAIELKNEECIIHPDLHYIAPQVISMVEDEILDIHDSQPDGDTDTAVTLPSVHKDLDYLGVDFKDDNTVFGDCSNNEFTPGAEDQVEVETSPTMEHDLNLDGCLVRCSDDPPEYEEIQSLASVNNECNGSSKLHHPERLLSTRKVQISSINLYDLIYFTASSLVDFSTGNFTIFSGKAL